MCWVDRHKASLQETCTKANHSMHIRYKQAHGNCRFAAPESAKPTGSALRGTGISVHGKWLKAYGK
jgi:hypothetical protein